MPPSFGDVDSVQPDDERVARRILRIEHHVVDAPIDRARQIKAQPLASIDGADGEAGAGDARGRSGDIRQADQSAHGTAVESHCRREDCRPGQ